MGSGVSTISRLLGKLQSCGDVVVKTGMRPVLQPVYPTLLIQILLKSSHGFISELLRLAVEPLEMTDRTFSSHKKNNLPSTNFSAHLRPAAVADVFVQLCLYRLAV